MKTLLVLLVAAVAAASASTDDDNFGYVSMVRQNYEMKVNNHLRRQVTLELMASYLYQAYASFFDRADIALPGVKKFFSESSKEEREHAEHLVEYINKRGGNMQFEDVKLIDACNTLSKEMKKENLQSGRQETCICFFMSQKREENNKRGDATCSSPVEDWRHALIALEDTLVIEKHVNSELLNIHKLASNNNDPHLTNFLEDVYLTEQVDAIKKLGGYITQLRKFTNDYKLGEYIFDQKL